MFLPLFLLVLQDPAEEEETRASAHLRAGAFLEKDPDGWTEALYHFERVIDFCPQATPEERTEARRRLHRLHARVPGNPDEKKAAVLRVSVLVWRHVNYRAPDKRSYRYRVGDAAVRHLRRGFEMFQRTVWEVTRGAVRIEGQVLPVEEEVRSLSVDGDGIWMHPDDLERNRLPRIKDAEFDLLISSVVAGEGLNFGRSVRIEPNFRGMRYANLLWTEGDIESNAAVGAREFRVWLGFATDLLRRRGGFRDGMIAAPDPKNDACYEGSKTEEHLWRRHVAEDHVTAWMWREIAGRPQAPFVRVWSLSPRFDHLDDKGLERTYLPETGEELDVRAWEVVPSKTDVFDLVPYAKGRPNGIFYASTYVYAKKRQWVKLFFGEDDCAKIFLNGQLVHAEHGHRGVEMDRYCFRLCLKEGRNFLLFKIENNGGPGGFCARLTDLLGQVPKVEISPVRK